MPTWAHRGVSAGDVPPLRNWKKFVFLKLESCNLMNMFGHKFRAGNELKNRSMDLTDPDFAFREKFWLTFC